jgi:hypothetical protein
MVTGLFDRMVTQDLVSWTQMISVCAKQAFKLNQLHKDDLKSDKVIFTSILTASNSRTTRTG